jgi:hypothetical protein
MQKVNNHNLHLPNSIPSLAPTFPLSTWIWVWSSDVLKSFHLGCQRFQLYNHIITALQGDVQMTFHFSLYKLTQNPYDVAS